MKKKLVKYGLSVFTVMVVVVTTIIMLNTDGNNLKTAIVAETNSARITVCARDITANGCKKDRSTTVNIPETGEYTVVGNIGRGTHNSECQANESFNLWIDGHFYVSSVDDDACEPGTTDVFKDHDFPNITLTQGAHTIRMIHSMWNQPETGHAESVSVSLKFSLSIDEEVCGDNNGKSFRNIHAQAYDTFCKDGTTVVWSDSVAADGTWNWSCGNDQCTATQIGGACGDNNGKSFDDIHAQEYATFCEDAGYVMWSDSVAADGTWNWSCGNDQCTATKNGSTAIGECACGTGSAEDSACAYGEVDYGLTILGGQEIPDSSRTEWVCRSSEEHPCSGGVDLGNGVTGALCSVAESGDGDCVTIDGCDTSYQDNPKCTGSTVPAIRCASGDEGVVMGEGDGYSYWYWSCRGESDSVADNDYCRLYKESSACGNANGVPTNTQPVSDTLCGASSSQVGAVTIMNVNSTEYWSWKCSTVDSSTITCAAECTGNCTISTPINGVCGTTVNSCTQGSLEDTTDSDADYRWNCNGLEDGQNVACTLPRGTTPINGVCGTTVNSCTQGSLEDTTDSDADYRWNCNGLEDGQNVACTLPIQTNDDDDDNNNNNDDDDDNDDDCDASIGNYIWYDTNGNGVQEDIEEGIEGVEVCAYNGDDKECDKTNSSGKYKIKDLCEHTYTVIVKDVDGMVQTYDPDGKKDNKTKVKLKDGDKYTKADFGYRGGSAPATGLTTNIALLIGISTLITIGILMIMKKKGAL